MPKDYKPDKDTSCVICAGEIRPGVTPYTWVKSKGYPPVFVHRECYRQLLPPRRRNDENER